MERWLWIASSLVNGVVCAVGQAKDITSQSEKEKCEPCKTTIKQTKIHYNIFANKYVCTSQFAVKLHCKMVNVSINIKVRVRRRVNFKFKMHQHVRNV